MNVLKNNAYYISVGDPWDFSSPDGENIINGSLINTCSKTYLIFKANYVLNFKKGSGDYFVIFPRYLNEDFTSLLNGSSTDVTINGSLLPNDFQTLQNEDLINHSLFVITGSLRST